MKNFSKLVSVFMLVFVLSSCGLTNPTDDEQPKTTQLTAPTNITFDGERIRFDSVPNATKYEINVNNTLKFESAGTSYLYDPNNEDFTVRVKAIGEGEFTNSNYSTDKTFVSLDQVTNIRLIDGIVHWDPVQNANGYILQINGVEQNDVLPINQYDGLVAGESYSIFVRPIRNDDTSVSYYSEYSNELTTTLIASPIPTFNYATKTVIWNAVAGAEGYNVKIYLNGQGVINEALGAETTSFNYGFLEVGTYHVEVQSTISGGSFNSSRYSSPIEVKRLAKPSTYTITDGTNVDVNVEISDVPGATAYEVRVNDVVKGMSTRNTFEHSFGESSIEVTHTVKVRSKGDGTTILDSVDELEFQLTKLATPTNITFNNGYVRWNEVPKNSGYIVVVDGTEYIVQVAEFQLPLVSQGLHTIRIRARGNSEYYVSSDMSNLSEFTKLANPINLVITNGILSWDPVAGASQYEISVGDLPSQFSNNTSYEVNPNDISTSTIIKVTALGNGADRIDSNFSESHAIFRLSAPTNLSSDNFNITWNAVTNVQYYRLKINSASYVVEGTSYPWANITASGNKVVTVQAIGDESVYFNSDESKAIDILKLETPIVTIQDNKFVWNHVIGTTAYQINVGTQVYNLLSTQREYTPIFTDAGIYSIKVRAMGNGLDSTASAYSELSHEVQALSTPTGSPVFQTTKNENILAITISQPVLNASGYVVNIGGIDYTSSTLNYNHTINSAGDYVIKVAAKGDSFFYVNSNYSAEKTITVLPRVSNVTFLYEDTDFYRLNWNSITNAVSYKVEVIKRDMNGNVIGSPGVFNATQTSLNISTIGVASVEVNITTIGNGTTTYSSMVFNQIFVPQGN